jgi:hypothetical protein
MRTCDILKTLGKGMVYGLGATITTAGGIVSYQNTRDFIAHHVAPANSTIETCLENWGEQNYQDVVELLYSLFILAPVALIIILYNCYKMWKKDRGYEYQPLIIPFHAPVEPPPKNNATKVLVGLVQGVLAAFLIVGMLGSITTFELADISKVFDDQHNNATVTECDDQWAQWNKIDFVRNWVLFIAALIISSFVTLNIQFGTFKGEEPNMAQLNPH